MKVRLFSFQRYFIFPFFIFVSLFCVSLNFLICSDRMHSEKQIFNIKLLNVEPQAGFLHSDLYYMEISRKLQYVEHDPSTLEDLMKKAVQASPANSDTFFSYAKYLLSKKCCYGQTSLLAQEAVKRNPTSMDLYPVAISAFLRNGQEDLAYEYFDRAVQLDEKSTMQLLEVMLRNGASLKQLIAKLPATPQHSRYLLKMIASLGSNYRTEWLKLFGKLQNVEPDEMLEIANQAFRIGEIEIAEDYALKAARSPGTHEGAVRLLRKIEFKKRQS